MPNVANYQEQGGSRDVIGGSLDVISGGDLDIESGGSFKLAGTAVTATAAELNVLDDVPASVTYVIGADVADVVNVGIQLVDAASTNIAGVKVVPWYMSSDSAGKDPLGTGVDGAVAIGTDGGLIQEVAKLSGLLITEADGHADVDFTDGGAFTQYFCVILPNGSINVSTVMTHDA